MRITFNTALPGIGARVLNKDSVKVGWYDPPTLVPLLQPSVHRINYSGFFGVPGLHEFDNVE